MKVGDKVKLLNSVYTPPKGYDPVKDPQGVHFLPGAEGEIESITEGHFNTLVDVFIAGMGRSYAFYTSEIEVIE